MAKRSVAPSPLSKPKPTIRFEFPDGLPKDLPNVEESVSLMVRGKLLKIAAKGGDYDMYATLTVQPDSVRVMSKEKP